MTKPIKMTEPQWNTLRDRLKRDYMPSVIMVRTKMRNVLGFTPRDHRYFDVKTNRYVEEVHLDFFNEPKRTMFVLKYSEYFDKSELD